MTDAATTQAVKAEGIHESCLKSPPVERRLAWMALTKMVAHTHGSCQMRLAMIAAHERKGTMQGSTVGPCPSRLLRVDDVHTATVLATVTWTGTSEHY